jgi:hypothetical protein
LVKQWEGQSFGKRLEERNGEDGGEMRGKMRIESGIMKMWEREDRRENG